MTFSIVAWDPAPASEPEWGIAVASKFLAVGAVVPWAEAKAGAVATQALANVSYGPRGLDLLRRGDAAPDVVAALTEADDDREHRQLGIVDSRGGVHSYTGRKCLDWAGGRSGDGFCCQGNILAGPEVVEAMEAAFSSTQGSLAARLVAALAEGDAAGGDRRGRQSAALYIAREGGGYGGTVDRAVDLRVDDHPGPIAELRRLLDMQQLYFPRPDDLVFIDIDEQLADQLRGLLSGLGYRPGIGPGPYDKKLKDALYDFVGTENLEERWTDEPKIERAVLDFLRRPRPSG